MGVYFLIPNAKNPQINVPDLPIKRIVPYGVSGINAMKPRKI
jgi:hypothetical protein